MRVDTRVPFSLFHLFDSVPGHTSTKKTHPTTASSLSTRTSDFHPSHCTPQPLEHEVEADSQGLQVWGTDLRLPHHQVNQVTSATG